MNISIIKKIAQLAPKFIYELKFGNLDKLGNILHENWKLKKRLSNGTSNNELDRIYRSGISAGASGGKLLGAGGGGFFLFYVPKINQNNFKKKMNILIDASNIVPDSGGFIHLNQLLENYETKEKEIIYVASSSKVIDKLKIDKKKVKYISNFFLNNGILFRFV